jgi:thiamine-monophosphate kinase
MIDVSDGVLSDLDHLLSHRKLGAALDAAAFPLRLPFRRAAAELSEDPLAAFLAGGEDYELLMAVRPNRYDAFLAEMRRFRCGVSAIGVVTDAPGVGVRLPDGRWRSGEELPRGFVHFPPPAPES